MSLEDAFTIVNQLNQAIVIGNTWGHLAPEPQRKYKGHIIIAIGCYHHETIIMEDEFNDLPDSPWQYNDLQNFVYQATSNFQPGVYHFGGWYKKFRNGNFQFGGGKFRQVKMGEVL